MPGAVIDHAAVNALHDETIDWRFKGMPSEAFGLPVRELLARRPRLFESGFVGPLLTLDRHALEHNLRTMADWCARHGVRLAPHGKTTMAPQLFKMQLEHGAWGITAANLSQLRVYRAFGVSRILLANQLIDPSGVRWLRDELARDPDFACACWVDSTRGVRLMSEAVGGSSDRPIDVLVEIGGRAGRTGVRTRQEGMEVARAVRDAPGLRLVGVGGYEGALAHGVEETALDAVDAYLDRMRELVGDLAADGHFDGLAEVIVSCGGSAYFDQVAEAITSEWPTGLPVLPVLRSGAYLTHDDGMYRRVSPFGRRHRLAGGEQPFRPAMRIWAEVTSRPEPELALLTMGRRDVSFDQGLPEPQMVRRLDGTTSALPEDSCALTSLADQHAFLTGPAGVDVGDWVGFGLSHPCTVFDKWPLIPVVDGDEVVDLIRTFF